MSDNAKFLCFGKEVVNINYIKRIRLDGRNIEIEFTDGITRVCPQANDELALDGMLYLLNFFNKL